MVQVYDLQGREVHRQTWTVDRSGRHETVLRIPHRLGNGVFLVRLTQQGRAAYARMIVVAG
jgi:hypothetical protein